MDTKLIKGKEVSQHLREAMKKETDLLKKQSIIPGLVVVLVGEDPASAIYVRNKEKACREIGIFSETLRLSAETSESELLNLVQRLNKDDRYHGILVQLPLPRQIREQIILESISPLKDVDCFHPENVGRLVAGKPYMMPCTPAGIVELIISAGISTEGKHAVVLGRSNIVGKPIANLLLQKNDRANATVTVVHSRTRDIASITRQADILIAAIGQPHFVKASMVKDNVVVIDVGMNRIPADNEKGYQLVGDVAFNEVLPKALKITPVPGGVGPMTITMLLKNTITAAKARGSSVRIEDE
jgi:methylenetetrahydrofolate dehydrogenase (NADP+)/methenyltetrahydrofolate cyclohydrolase